MVFATNDEKALAVTRHKTSVTQGALQRLPIVDLTAPALESSAALLSACQDLGFFYLKGHGFPARELEDALSAGLAFFALPEEVKRRSLARNKFGIGFIPKGGLSAGGAGNPDNKERFYIARDLEPGETLDPDNPAGTAIWPADTDAPGFRAVLENHLAKCLSAYGRLMQLAAIGLGVDRSVLGAPHERMGCILSLNYYPASPDQRDWGFSPHTDYGCFTILHQDGNGGLEVQNAAGEWIGVPPLPGAFVVNVGDLLQRWTNDRFVSSLHRVVSRTSAPRLSMSFFGYPNPQSVINCIPACIPSDAQQAYEPVTAGAYIASLLSQALRTGRAGISERTADRLTRS